MTFPFSHCFAHFFILCFVRHFDFRATFLPVFHLTVGFGHNLYHKLKMGKNRKSKGAGGKKVLTSYSTWQTGVGSGTGWTRSGLFSW